MPSIPRTRLEQVSATIARDKILFWLRLFRRTPPTPDKAKRTTNQRQHHVPNTAFVLRDIYDRLQLFLVQTCFGDAPGKTISTILY